MRFGLTLGSQATFRQQVQSLCEPERLRNSILGPRIGSVPPVRVLSNTSASSDDRDSVPTFAPPPATSGLSAFSHGSAFPESTMAEPECDDETHSTAMQEIPLRAEKQHI